MEQTKITLTDFEFAALGKGEVGYIRMMKSEDLTRRFPALSQIAPGLNVWALFAANGEPIILFRSAGLFERSGMFGGVVLLGGSFNFRDIVSDA